MDREWLSAIAMIIIDNDLPSNAKRKCRKFVNLIWEWGYICPSDKKQLYKIIRDHFKKGE